MSSALLAPPTAGCVNTFRCGNPPYELPVLQTPTDYALERKIILRTWNVRYSLAYVDGGFTIAARPGLLPPRW